MSAGAVQFLGTIPPWHWAVLAIGDCPNDRTRAKRYHGAERREELVAEAIATALVAFVHLVELGKADLAYPSVLAQYAVAQVRAGRRTATRANSRDVCSRACQAKNGFTVEQLDNRNGNPVWQDALADNSRTPVPDAVAFRLDFPEWLRSMPARDRRIVEALSTGRTTNEVSRRFAVTPGRVSQLRREFCESWRTFHGELV